MIHYSSQVTIARPPRAVFEAIGHEKKQLSVIEGANHYYSGQKEHLRSAVDHIDGWLTQNGFGR